MPPSRDELTDEILMMPRVHFPRMGLPARRLMLDRHVVRELCKICDADLEHMLRLDKLAHVDNCVRKAEAIVYRWHKRQKQFWSCPTGQP